MFSIKISCCTVLSCVDIQFFALYKFYRKLKRVHAIFRNDYTKFTTDWLQIQIRKFANNCGG